MSKGDEADPKGLIAEAYRIDGISAGECRTIFLDWALSVPGNADVPALIERLLARHGVPGHPMTEVLADGRAAGAQPRRRGGARGRRS
ncbi:hypothetical protein [Salipiger mucosus]|uniref:Uncharacterized protein n=1 Tax=Salipiger mucosus DSM 16094 TaxID=1123237 RepID=S9QLE9_9RHOB|nr:hypothetical protein [Salipiger mucosus]EPX80428.1 hypothetical protein Salmuc_03744 [Salipiger mucosus DSM 16094]